MFINRKRIGEILVSQRLISVEQRDAALVLQQKHFQPLGQILIQQGCITEKRFLQACAMQKGVRAWHLPELAPTPEALAQVPRELCRKHRVLPLQIVGTTLTLGMQDPSDVDATDLVRSLCKMRIDPVMVSEERLTEILGAAYTKGGQDADVTVELSRFVTKAMDEFEADSLNRVAGEVSEAEMRPVVGLVNQIFTEAIRRRTSDIHIEPHKDRIEIRFRVDGRLQKVHSFPVKLLAALVARIKILAVLDIVEHRLPQDGRISITLDERVVDMRVSILPHYHGERIVLRVLDKSVVLRELPELGFSDHNLGLFSEMIVKPYGLVLVTGPTGSGKTTTLYASLNRLKEAGNNIMTCEDPVEYDIDGINQSQVNEKFGLTFGVQLRALLRQDPDIVLVGEIRDRETAEIALRAAMTGHLVLSTLHCNDAASAVPRLIDMGVEPFLLSTALIGVTAQRLIRVLCAHCKQQYSSTPEERLMFGPEFAGDMPMLWRPVGCPECNHLGYQGRIAVHEVLPVTPEVQRTIAHGESVDSLRQKAAIYGYRPMQSDACARVLDGQTSLAEARRLIFFDTTRPAQVALIRAAAEARDPGLAAPQGPAAPATAALRSAAR